MNRYQQYTDQELTDLLKSGDQRAYTQIYDRYQGLLYIYACKITKEENDAEDIVQEVFFNLLDHKKVRADYAESFHKFLKAGSVQADYRIRERELIKLIEKEIALLPPKMREIFELSRKHQLSHKEIAERLGISEKTVKNQVNNALKELRVKLGIFTFLIFLIKF